MAISASIRSRCGCAMRAASPRSKDLQPFERAEQESPEELFQMIDFELEPQTQKRIALYHTVAEQMMRPISREYDEREHEKPWDFLNAMWAASTAPGGDPMGAGDASGQGGPKLRNVDTVATTEELCWGDAGLFLS